MSRSASTSCRGAPRNGCPCPFPAHAYTGTLCKNVPPPHPALFTRMAGAALAISVSGTQSKDLLSLRGSSKTCGCPLLRSSVFNTTDGRDTGHLLCRCASLWDGAFKHYKLALPPLITTWDGLLGVNSRKEACSTRINSAPLRDKFGAVNLHLEGLGSKHLSQEAVNFPTQPLAKVGPCVVHDMGPPLFSFPPHSEPMCCSRHVSSCGRFTPSFQVRAVGYTRHCSLY